jgi:hypothetical protein
MDGSPVKQSTSDSVNSINHILIRLRPLTQELRKLKAHIHRNTWRSTREPPAQR